MENGGFVTTDAPPSLPLALLFCEQAIPLGRRKGQMPRKDVQVRGSTGSCGDIAYGYGPRCQSRPECNSKCTIFSNLSLGPESQTHLFGHTEEGRERAQFGPNAPLIYPFRISGDVYGRRRRRCNGKAPIVHHEMKRRPSQSYDSSRLIRSQGLKRRRRRGGKRA